MSFSNRILVYLGMFLFMFGGIYCITQLFAIVLDRPLSFLTFKIEKLSWIFFFALLATLIGFWLIRKQKR